MRTRVKHRLFQIIKSLVLSVKSVESVVKFLKQWYSCPINCQMSGHCCAIQKNDIVPGKKANLLQQIFIAAG